MGCCFCKKVDERYVPVTYNPNDYDEFGRKTEVRGCLWFKKRVVVQEEEEVGLTARPYQL